MTWHLPDLGEGTGPKMNTKEKKANHVLDTWLPGLLLCRARRAGPL